MAQQDQKQSTQSQPQKGQMDQKSSNWNQQDSKVKPQTSSATSAPIKQDKSDAADLDE